MDRSYEEAVNALGRLAAEIDDVAAGWAAVDEHAPGPALLRSWRAEIVWSLMALGADAAGDPRGD